MSHCWEKKEGRKQIKSSNSNKSINYMQMLYWICSSTALMYAAKTTQQKYFPHLSQIQMHWVSILDAEHDFSVVYTIINIAFHTNARFTFQVFIERSKRRLEKRFLQFSNNYALFAASFERNSGRSSHKTVLVRQHFRDVLIEQSSSGHVWASHLSQGQYFHLAVW